MNVADRNGQKPKKKPSIFQSIKNRFKGKGKRFGGDDKDDGKINRIFDACAVIANKNKAKDLMQDVNKLRNLSMVDNNNNNNPTRQQKFAGIWVDFTCLNIGNI